MQDSARALQRLWRPIDDAARTGAGGSEPGQPLPAELAIYRIAQESLTNIARHAHARRATISLDRGVDSVVLRVADDGSGFADGVLPEGHGGLRGMRERAVLVGAALAIKQTRAGGVEVRLEVPALPVEAPVAVG